MTDENTTPSRGDKAFTALYNELARKAELKLVLLMYSKFESKEDLMPAIANDRLKLSYGNKDKDFDFNDDVKVASINCSFDAIGKEGRKRLLVMEAEYQVIYTNITTDNEEVITTFLHRVGKFAAYPYFRSLAAQYSWSGHIPIPPLPVLVE